MDFIIFLSYFLASSAVAFLSFLFITFVFTLAKFGLAITKLQKKVMLLEYDDFMEYWRQIGELFWIKHHK